MKTYWVVIENAKGEDTEAVASRMTAEEIREKFTGKGSLQSGVAIFDGELIKDFESRMDLNRL